MKQLILAPRKEDHDCYEANRTINELISKSFRSSVSSISDDAIISITMNPVCEKIITTQTPFWITPTRSIPAGDIKYGSTTLKESGCAVFCFQQIATLKTNRCISISDLASEIYSKGYYEPGKGTWHNLFDHFGLKRASHFQEILFAIGRDGIVTCLVDNSVYHSDHKRVGKHFVNLTGFDKTNAIIDDPNIGRCSMDFRKLLNAICVAWVF